MLKTETFKNEHNASLIVYVMRNRNHMGSMKVIYHRAGEQVVRGYYRDVHGNGESGVRKIGF